MLNAALHCCALGQIEFGREECYKGKKIFPGMMAMAGGQPFFFSMFGSMMDIDILVFTENAICSYKLSYLVRP